MMVEAALGTSVDFSEGSGHGFTCANKVWVHIAGAGALVFVAFGLKSGVLEETSATAVAFFDHSYVNFIPFVLNAFAIEECASS